MTVLAKLLVCVLQLLGRRPFGGAAAPELISKAFPDNSLLRNLADAQSDYRCPCAARAEALRIAGKLARFPCFLKNYPVLRPLTGYFESVCIVWFLVRRHYLKYQLTVGA